jgi:hypothetical protein
MSGKRSDTTGYVMAEGGLMIVGFGVRFVRPMDDTTTFGIEHRTTGGYVGVLFERKQFAELAEWLAVDEPGQPDEPLAPWVQPTDSRGVPGYVREIHRTRSEFRIIDGQTAARLSKRDGGLKVSAWWLGSGTRRAAVLSPATARELAEWVADKNVNGWIGWRSGRDGTAEA